MSVVDPTPYLERIQDREEAEFDDTETFVRRRSREPIRAIDHGGAASGFEAAG